MRNNSNFVIMSASCLTDGKAVDIKGAHEEWENSNDTILVATRHYGYDKTSKIYVHGSGIGYKVKAGDRVTYTQDTGMGHKCIGYQLDIENVVEMHPDGSMTAENDIGLKGKRRLWVMK